MRTDVPAVAAVGVRKSHGQVEAVRGVDLTVAQGEIFGFLGPNGAGKTTMISILCTLTRPDAGRVRVAGFDVGTERHQVRRSLGLVFQQPTIDGELTVAENLRFHADLYALPRAGLAARIAAMLELAGLADSAGVPAGTLSGGMRRRLEIVRALSHRPSVLFLDEPTVGLDPQSRADIWRHIREVRRLTGVSVFLTTHYLDEAEHCDRIAIIDRGRVVAGGTPDSLKSVIGADRVELRTGDNPTVARLLWERFDLPATVVGDRVSVRVTDGARMVPVLCAALDIPIHEVTVTRPSLDDVFLHHTGREIHQ